MNLEPILWGFVVVGGIAFVLFAWKCLSEKASEKSSVNLWKPILKRAFLKLRVEVKKLFGRMGFQK